MIGSVNLSAFETGRGLANRHHYPKLVNVRPMKRGASILGGSAMVVAVALLVAAAPSAAPPAKDEIIPLIQMENTPLPEALRQMAAKAHLNILLDPRLSQPPFNGMTVSVRWENVTAREALEALLDNYGLVLVETLHSSRSVEK